MDIVSYVTKNHVILHLITHKIVWTFLFLWLPTRGVMLKLQTMALKTWLSDFRFFLEQKHTSQFAATEKVLSDTTALWNSFGSWALQPISELRYVWSLHAPRQGEVKSPDLWWWQGWQMSCQLCNGFVLMTEWVTTRVYAGSLLNTYWITVTQFSFFSDAIYCNNVWSVCHST